MFILSSVLYKLSVINNTALMGNQLCQQCFIAAELIDKDDKALQQYKNNLKIQKLDQNQPEIVLTQDQYIQNQQTNNICQDKNQQNQKLSDQNFNQSTYLTNLTQSNEKLAHDSKVSLHKYNHPIPQYQEIRLPDGSIFKGQTINGVPNGKGIEEHMCGDRYQGQFNNGMKHGYGVYFYAGEGTYRGNFSHGHMDGYGEFQWQNGDIYKGQFKQNQKHGQGKYYCKQGYYQGMYQRGQRSGLGKIKCRNHELQGVWENNKILIDHVLVPYCCKEQQIEQKQNAAVILH